MLSATSDGSTSLYEGPGRLKEIPWFIAGLSWKFWPHAVPSNFPARQRRARPGHAEGSDTRLRLSAFMEVLAARCAVQLP
ncbi:MAG: hypothetical protein O2780_20880, partial [Proteobacteria bacterium]|nr:hypothetical protein [Pseudomonadota bacterium]